MLGWWNAYDNYVASGLDTKAYGLQAGKQSTAWKADTIEQMVNHIKWAVENGYKRAEFRSVAHIRATRYPKKATTKADNKTNGTAVTLSYKDADKRLALKGYAPAMRKEILTALGLHK